MKRTFLALAILLACGGSLTAQAADANPAFVAARQQFIAGSGGDASARDAAIEAFEKLYAGSQPGNPVFLAYQGAATAMRGRDASMPWEKMKFAEKGADMLEKAVALLAPEHDSLLLNGTPVSIETRAVAANALLSLPGFMNRRAGGKRALQAALESPVLSQASAPVRANLFATAARVAADEKRSTDEIGYLQQVVATQANTPHVAKAAARLKELGQ